MLSAKCVEYSYLGSKSPLFSDLNLHIETGSICGLLGANGAGKSTLLKLFGGFIQPSSGDCQVAGYKPSERLPAFLNSMFFLPEETVAPPLTIAEYITRMAPFYPGFDLELFGVLEGKFKLLSGKKLNDFSLGQKKKFFISFGIATSASLLILDEPTNGLDIPSKKVFQEILRDHRSTQRCFVISTHQANDIEGLVDALVIIDEGKIVLNETIDSIATSLTFTMEDALPDDALFHERVGSSFATLRNNCDGKRNHIDLRLLFGFVTSNSQKVGEIFLSKLTK
jgi:ABC-2 type transport system ATP-binding protein